jgi:hypothetical protein
MNPVKRLGLAAAVVVGMTLLASPSAWAKDKQFNWGTVQLTNTGAEPEASGSATMTDVVCTLDYWEVSGGDFPWAYVRQEYTGVLKVKCNNLTPGATYWTPAGTFIADPRGTGTVSGRVDFAIEYTYGWVMTYYEWLVVDVVGESGAVVLAGDYFGSVK